jgi:hypothetical protein
MVQLKKKTNRDRMARSQVDISSSNKDNNSSNISSLLSLQSRLSTAAYYNNRLENVLILQGGGSLRAFGCGVFKALTNKGHPSVE